MEAMTQARPSRLKNVTAWLAANALDAATTYVGLQLGGVEGNPFPAFVLARFGVAPFWALKVCLTPILPLATVYVVRRYPYAESFAWRFMWLSTAVVALVAGWGLYVIAG